MNIKHIGRVGLSVVIVLFGALMLMAYQLDGRNVTAVFYGVVGLILSALILFGISIAGRLCTTRARRTAGRKPPRS
jgi:hypothetical protein